MGVADKDNKPTTLEYERERVKDFIERVLTQADHWIEPMRNWIETAISI